MITSTTEKYAQRPRKARKLSYEAHQKALHKVARGTIAVHQESKHVAFTLHNLCYISHFGRGSMYRFEDDMWQIMEPTTFLDKLMEYASKFFMVMFGRVHKVPCTRFCNAIKYSENTGEL